MLIDFKDEDFDSKIKNEDVSVIQFSADWCGPCKALKPVMDKLAVEYKDKAGFYYADIEDAGINTGSAAGIRGVPTVIVYKKGIEVHARSVFLQGLLLMSGKSMPNKFNRWSSLWKLWYEWKSI